MDTDTTTLEYADLELSLDRLAPGRYRLRMTYQAPHSDAPVALYDKPNTEIALENAVLSALHLEPAAYGRSLGALLFADPDALAGFRKGYGMARSGGFGLRLRLVLDVSDPQLNDLAWETLTLPGDTTPLAQDERLALSRFLGSSDEAPVTTPMRSTLRGLAVVANPADGDAYGLSPVNAAWMLEGVREGLPAATWTELDSDGKTHLDTIVEHLRAGCDLFTLTCHGVVRDGEPWLYLETNTGMTDEVSGCTLAAAIATLPRKPLLAILASCASSGELGGAPLQAVGPLLVQAGVPAVIAMHGAVQQATARRFLAVMSQELARHGVIDRAAAAARWAVRNEPDWWAPVVWLRLASGRLWAETPPHVRRRADFYRHIDLPPHYIRRPELLAEIKATVLAGLMPGQPVALTAAVKVHVDALHGMGGIGKTVVARALCDDPDVQAAYPDGILWATVGQTPDLLPQLRDWIRELGGIVSENVPTVASLKNLLAGLLAERACLLVADDVWRVEDARTFLIPASGCRVLITTRDAAVAAEVGAAVRPVPLMAHEEALALLRAWGGKHLENVDDARLTPIMGRLGRLPLAIKLAGPHFADSDPERWLKEFDLRDLEAPRVEGAHRSLVVTFGLSLDRLAAQERHLYAALTVFPEDEPIPPVAVEKLWGELGGLTGRQVRRRLRDLADRALLQMAAGHDDGEPVVVLHDLLRDLMALELGEAGALAAHGALVAAYRKTQSGEGWHTAPDDGYLYAHLAYHLEKLAATEATALAGMERLFADDGWMRVRVAADDYQYDGYLADLDRYWNMIHRRLVAQIERGEDDAALGQSVRCALILTSINSLSGNYSPELVERAVETGVWPVSRGLSVAAKVPSVGLRAPMFAAVLATGCCTPEQHRLGIQAVLDAIIAAGRNGISEVRRRTVWAVFTHNCQGHMLERALDVALSYQTSWNMLDALLALAPKLEGDLLQRGVDAAFAVQGREESRLPTLAALSSNLQGETKVRVLEQILNDALAIQNEIPRSSVLVAIAPKLQGDSFQRALNAVFTIQDEWRLSHALAALAPHLQGETKATALQKGMEAALAIKDEGDRLGALTSLIPNLEGEMRAQALQNGLNAAFATKDFLYHSEALVALAANLQGEKKEAVLQWALDAIWTIQDENYLLYTLVPLIPGLQGEMKKKALQRGLDATLALPMQRDNHRLLIQSDALAFLAPSLEGDMLQRGLDAALSIHDEFSCSTVLAAFATKLHGKTKDIALQKGMDAALAIQYERGRSKALITLAALLQGEKRDIVLKQSLDAALSIQGHDESVRAEALIELASNLQGEMLQRGFEAVLTIRDVRSRAEALAAFAPRLQGEMRTHILEQSINDTLAIEDERDRSWVLTTLIPNLQGNMLHRGVAAVLAIQDEEVRANALKRIASHLQGDLLPIGMDAVLAIQDEYTRAGALIELIPHLQEDLLQIGMDAVLAIQDEEIRAGALIELIPRLHEDLLKIGMDAVLAIQDEETRAGALIELIPNLRGETKVQALQKGLDAVLTIQDAQVRSLGFALLAPNLQGNTKEMVLQQELGIAFAIQDVDTRVHVLAMLAPILQGKTKEMVSRQGLAAAFAIQDELRRSFALAALAANLEGEFRETALQQALATAFAIQDARDRASALGTLEGMLSLQLNAISIRQYGFEDFPYRYVEIGLKSLAALSHHLTSVAHLIQVRRQVATDLRAACRQSSRSTFLAYLSTPNLIAPPLFSPTTIAAVAEAIIDVTTQWRWL